MRAPNRYNIEELLQIFSTQNLGNSSQRRRPQKGGTSYASLHDGATNNNQQVMGLYPHDTYKIRPEFLGMPQPGFLGEIVTASNTKEATKKGGVNGSQPWEKGKKKSTSTE